jgi:hypothetical protein
MQALGILPAYAVIMTEIRPAKIMLVLIDSTLFIWIGYLLHYINVLSA